MKQYGVEATALQYKQILAHMLKQAGSTKIYYSKGPPTFTPLENCYGNHRENGHRRPRVRGIHAYSTFPGGRCNRRG